MHSAHNQRTLDEEEEEDDCATPAERAAAARAALTARALAFFRRVPFFDSTPLSALEGLAAAAHFYTTTRNEVVVQQGAPSDDGIFFIVRGQFRVVQELPIYARAVDEKEAAREFALPPLSPEAAAAQRARLQVAEERHAQRQSIESSVEPSPYSSRTSLHNTFLTADQTRSSQSLAPPPSGRSPRNHRAPPSSASLSAAASASASASVRDLTAINEATPADSSNDGEYVDLDAYEAKSNQALQHRRRQSQQQQQHQQSSPRADGSPRKSAHHPSSSLASLSISSPRSAAASAPRAKQSILVGSRFLDVGELGPFSMFGERGVMLRAPRSASVISRSTGGELWAITRFDFLRLQTRKALHALRTQTAGAYRSVAELTLELDDSDQWSRYKTHLLHCSKDRGATSHKLAQMPVWETVPVKPFSIRLPQMRNEQITSSTDHMQPTVKADKADAAAAAAAGKRAKHRASSGPTAAAAASSTPPTVFGDPRPSEQYSSRKGVMPPISSASKSRSSASGSNTARNAATKQTKAEASRQAAHGAQTAR